MPELPSPKSAKLDALVPPPMKGRGATIKDAADDSDDEDGRDEGEFAPGGDADYFEEEVRVSSLHSSRHMR